MTYVLGGFVLSIMLTALFMWRLHNVKPGKFEEVPLGLMTSCSGLCGLILLIIYCCMGWDWYAAGYKVKIVNREYNVNYTQEEMFYAKDVIETIQQISRKRIEVNGNVMSNKNPAINSVTDTSTDTSTGVTR